MHVTINGNQTELEGPVTVLALLEKKGLNPTTVVVELNRDILPGDMFESTTLTGGETLEILRFVGGG